MVSWKRRGCRVEVKVLPIMVRVGGGGVVVVVVFEDVVVVGLLEDERGGERRTEVTMMCGMR